MGMYIIYIGLRENNTPQGLPSCLRIYRGIPQLVVKDVIHYTGEYHSWKLKMLYTIKENTQVVLGGLIYIIQDNTPVFC